MSGWKGGLKAQFEEWRKQAQYLSFSADARQNPSERVLSLQLRVQQLNNLTILRNAEMRFE